MNEKDRGQEPKTRNCGMDPSVQVAGAQKDLTVKKKYKQREGLIEVRNV